MVTMATFTELVQELKKWPFREKRADSDDRLEFIVKRDEFEKLTPVLESFFGPAQKPAGQKPSREMESLAAEFGGVMKGQTLFHIEKDGAPYLGLIWPWADNQHVTVKIFKL